VRIAIAADHNGVQHKADLIRWLAARGDDIDDRGAHDPDTVVDYPPLCADVARQVLDGQADLGIVIGGSGQGEAIACNKIRGIRAGVCQDLFSAEISRAHNDANVLVLPAKILDVEQARAVAQVWLDTAFKGGRHQRRVEQIQALEQGEPLT
jgi:ribose 5-phosphate isomerase B